jgi:hypothetical protein
MGKTREEKIEVVEELLRKLKEYDVKVTVNHTFGEVLCWANNYSMNAFSLTYATPPAKTIEVGSRWAVGYIVDTLQDRLTHCKKHQDYLNGTIEVRDVIKVIQDFK